MEKIFNQKSFHYFFWTPLGSRIIIQINYFFNFTLSCQLFDHCSHCLPPVSLTPVTNLPPVSVELVAKFNSPPVPKMIREKIWSKKSRDTVPLKGLKIRALCVDRGSGELPLEHPPPLFGWIHGIFPFLCSQTTFRLDLLFPVMLFTTTVPEMVLSRRHYWSPNFPPFVPFLSLPGKKNILWMNKNRIHAHSSCLCFCLLYYRLL